MKFMRQIALSLLLLAGIGEAAAQQAQVQDGIPVRPLSRARVLASEQQIDQQAARQYTALMQEAAQKGALYPANHPQVRRLREIAQRIIPHATRWNPAAANWRWQVNLLNSRQVNAFCMPGGRIAFFAGILQQLQLTDAEAAAIMGHEMAHALREHSRAQAGKSALTSLGARLAGIGFSAWFGIDPNVTGAIANAAGQLTVLKFSRDDEREADLIGLDLAARAGYDPRAGISLWRKMEQLKRNAGGEAPLQFLSTHPGGEHRIADMQRHMNALLPVYQRASGVAQR
jgi:predicted Zn-dependent protease